MIAPSNPRRKETALTQPPETVASLLANADKILSDVDKSSLMRVREKRRYPTFDASEVDTGEVLGIGGFGVVSEVSDIRVDRSQPQSDGESDSQDSQGSKCAGIGHLPTVTIELHPEHHDHQDRHYEVATAKRQIASRVMRSGKARYAIKKLNPSLSELDRTRGMIDMALEIKYLSVLWHPNIVKMRGVCAGDMLHPESFIIMDRLFETLETRMKSWRSQKNKINGVFGIGRDKNARNMLLVQRLIVAYDLASALAYMHENSLIYRDIKQENFGFDIRGDIKIFDFGLSKALSPTLLAKKSKTMYNLTPVTGSIPYMAPEVTLKLPYNCRCDCFSFALLFHEILALRKTPFHTYPPQEYFQRVVKGNERPTIRTSWPATDVLKDGWDFDPGKRPPMKSIASMIRSELYERSEQDSVLNRSMYMNDKSIRSLQGLDC